MTCVKSSSSVMCHSDYMNYFAPADSGSRFTSSNRGNEHAYSDRDSRFRGGLDGGRFSGRGGSRGGSRGN